MPYLLVGLLLLSLALVAYLVFAGPKLPPGTDALLDDVLARELPELVTGQSGWADSGGLKIWYERRAPTGPARGTVLLNSSLGGDAFSWPLPCLRTLAQAGYYVIRYDYRGTGLSDWMEQWNSQHPYAVADLARDALAVLDALGVERAHVFGLSLGGMVAQEIALQQPARVASLTLLMTSGYIGDPDLPGLTSSYFFSLLATGLPLLKYRLRGGEKNLIKERLAKTLLVIKPADLDVRELAEVVLYELRRRRGLNLRAIQQHQTAVTVAGSRYARLRTLNTPTLVIHGTADRFIPVEHGRQLAQVIPHAQGLWLAGVGHLFPVPNLAAVMERVFAHWASSERDLAASA